MTQLQDLVAEIGRINDTHGFNEYASIPAEYKDLYIGNKMMLMVGEVAEAQEEVRAGVPLTETYYPAGPVPASLAVEFASGGDAQAYWDKIHAESPGLKKPEGVPSELADTIIRALALAYELGIDIESAIYEKMAYNDTRPFKHGKKF